MCLILATNPKPQSNGIGWGGVLTFEHVRLEKLKGFCHPRKQGLYLSLILFLCFVSKL